MFPLSPALRGRSLLIVLALISPVLADDPPRPDSPLVKLLKRAPAERQGAVVSRIGQIGSPADLGYLLEQAARPDGFTPPVRVAALGALADAALTRKGIRPDGDLANLGLLMAPKADPAARLAAVRLAGLWKVESLVPALVAAANDRETDEPTRSAAIESLGEIGAPAREAILALTAPSQTKSVRARAVAAFAKIDPEAAAGKAADLIRQAEKDQDFTSMMAAFLNRKDGADLLARAIASEKLPADNAKLALRAVYALGHADPSLIAALSKAAGIDAEVKPPTKEQMDAIVAEVAARGDAGRGERVFRRADLSCMKCHAVSGAAGGVGPELSSVGLSSPVDFVVNSIMQPDQAIKEQYGTLVVATSDGQVFQGIVADKDDKKIVLREATGDLRTVPTSEIDESKPGGSLMPKGLPNLLTHDEFLDLVRFISELGKPGPYALHATPTIQRWRVMTQVTEELANSVPDAGAFVAKVRDSDPSLWVAAYALAPGAIPLDEFAATAESPVVYARGEIDVTAPGPISIDFGDDLEVRAWLDETPAPRGKPLVRDLAVGRHTLTLRIDTRTPHRSPIKVQVVKAPGSSAEFTVVGGR